MKNPHSTQNAVDRGFERYGLIATTDRLEKLEYWMVAKELPSLPDQSGSMRKLTTNGSRLLLLGAALSCVSVLLVAFANVFPDQTWTALNTAKTVYADAVSRMTPVPIGATRRAEEDRIREALFRYLIGFHKTSRPIYLSIDGKNPSDDFMARFADLKPPVRGVSEGKPTVKGWLDRSTCERGVVLSVDSVKWSFGDRVEVDGSGGVYEVVRNRDHWNVESVIVHRFP